MKPNKALSGRIGWCLAIAGATLAASASATVLPNEKKYLTGPLEICDQGSFHIGGVPKVTNYALSATAEGAPNQIIIGQMYVQFQIPRKHRQWPLIMVHGSGYSGACLEATPDGREGWAPYAVRHNLATYVVDQAGRARSSFDRSVLHEARITGNVALIPTIGGATSSTMWTSWLGHLIPAGSTILDGTLIRHGDPGDPDSPARHGVYPPAYPIPPVPDSIDPNIEARVGAIGPAPNPANNTYLALNTYKQLVPNTESTLPGGTCASCTPTTLPPTSVWTPKALAELVERLGGAIVATHSQSGIMGQHMARVLKENGNLHMLKGLLTLEGSCSLTLSGLQPSDLDEVPYMAFRGDYTEPTGGFAGCQETIDALNASPTRTAPAEYVQLDDPKYGDQFNGVTHMFMLDTKSHEVMDVILGWANENIPNQPAATKCR